jgi:hypothetical protein
MISRRFATRTNAPESLRVATASLHMNCVCLSYLLLYVDRRTRYIQDSAHLSPHPYAPWLCNPPHPKQSPNQKVCYHSLVDLLLDAATTPPYIGIRHLLKHAAGTALGDPITKNPAATQYGGISSLYHEPGAHGTTLDFTRRYRNSTCTNPGLISVSVPPRPNHVSLGALNYFYAFTPIFNRFEATRKSFTEIFLTFSPQNPSRATYFDSSTTDLRLRLRLLPIPQSS